MVAGLFKLLSSVLFALAFFIISINVGDNYVEPLPFWARHVDVVYIYIPILGFVVAYTAALKWASKGSRPVSQHS